MVKSELHFNHEKYSDAQLNTSISEILNDNILLAMSTIMGSESWINTAYYCFNSRLDFYVLTEPTTQHSENLANDKSIALAIYDSQQGWDENKRGLQVFGLCERASGAQLAEAVKLYSRRFAGLSQWIKHPRDFTKGIINSRFYIIKTNRLKLFDETYFEKEEFIPLSITDNCTSSRCLQT